MLDSSQSRATADAEKIPTVNYGVRETETRQMCSGIQTHLEGGMSLSVGPMAKIERP